MAAWAFECLLCQASQKSCLAPWELGESWWEGCLAGSPPAVWSRAPCMHPPLLLSPAGKGQLGRSGLHHQD